MASPRKGLWWLWAALSLALSAYFGLALSAKDTGGWQARARAWFLPGETSHGHHQIELSCGTCHGEGLAAADALQEACERCHGAELKEARDSHPQSKFTDPRNADRAARLDAARCVTCHVEHRPGITGAAGLTLPADYCVICHDEVAKERPSHQGLAFDTCGNSGCHNFHDNRALYEDFLLKHAEAPPLLAEPRMPARDWRQVIEELGSYPIDRYPLAPLAAPDVPADDAGIVRDWLETAHARSGVNCSACHGAGKDWVARPGHDACKGCHGAEVETWLAGKHGMRLAAGLGSMRPADARQPMKAAAAQRALGCTSCHAAHRFDTARAAVESCLECHADDHSRAYLGSPHHRLWQQERAGLLPAGSGVTCASCHLPRIEHRTDDVKRMLVQHNQNDTLRPSDKMLRPVCLNCHGLQFALDALADAALVAGNFKGRPQARVASISMAKEAEARAQASRRAAAGPEEGGGDNP